MIQLYDTVKDTQGNRYRVVEMTESLASIKGITTDNKTKPGKARTVTLQDLENKFARIDLPPVKVTKIAPHEKAMQAEAQAVKEMQKEAAARTASKAEMKTVSAEDEIAAQQEIIARQMDRIEELEDENRRLLDMNEQTNNQLYVRDQEGINLRAQVEELEEMLVKVRQENKDLTKTISKLKQNHAAAVEDMQDTIMELEIECKKKNQYSDRLDDDGVTFAKIGMLALSIKNAVAAVESMASVIQDEVEEKV